MHRATDAFLTRSLFRTSCTDATLFHPARSISAWTSDLAKIVVGNNEMDLHEGSNLRRDPRCFRRLRSRVERGYFLGILGLVQCPCPVLGPVSIGASFPHNARSPDRSRERLVSRSETRMGKSTERDLSTLAPLESKFNDRLGRIPPTSCLDIFASCALQVTITTRSKASRQLHCASGKITLLQSRAAFVEPRIFYSLICLLVSVFEP